VKAERLIFASHFLVPAVAGLGISRHGMTDGGGSEGVGILDVMEQPLGEEVVDFGAGDQGVLPELIPGVVDRVDEILVLLSVQVQLGVSTVGHESFFFGEVDFGVILQGFNRTTRDKLKKHVPSCR
jgi:hypothetical protein